MPSPAFETLPDLHAKWAAGLLGRGIPRETRATCDSCAMCGDGTEVFPPAAEFFEPDVKCCTYVPILPSFLAGRVLADTDPAAAFGRESLRRRIAARAGVTPLGLAVPPLDALLYQHGGADGFGRSRALLCPHFEKEGARCGIWRSRNAVCATWFCKFVRGAVGFRFWAGLRGLLRAVEVDLARWCVTRLDLGDAALAALIDSPEWRETEATLDRHALAGGRAPEAYTRLWGSWAGREEAFYQACAALIEPLDWAGVLAICGPEVAARARAVTDSFARMIAARPPVAPRAAPFQVVASGRETTRIVTFSTLDPLDLPNALLEVLPAFDGRPTRAAIAGIEAEKGLRLTPGLVRKLADFDVLTEAGPGPSARSGRRPRRGAGGSRS